MNSHKPIIRAPKHTMMGRWMVSVALLALLAGCVAAQDRPVSQAISADLQDRWYQVTAGKLSGELADWVAEGQQILDRIHELESLKDRALAQSPETLAEIESLRLQFIDLLKMVERGRIARMSPEELRAMRDDYVAERDRDMRMLARERKALIARAEEFLRTLDTNEFLIRHPERAGVLEDFLYRLGDLYYQDAGAEFLQAFDQWNEQVELARARGEEAPLRPEPDYSQAEESYLRILNEYPHGRYVDDCLYNLAKIYESDKDPSASAKVLEYYQRLVASYPDSPHLSSAYLGIGDYYFFKEVPQPEELLPHMQRAIEAYQAVLDTPDELLYNDAYFKMGWSHYRVDHFPEAVDAFTRCIETTLKLKDKLDLSEYQSFYDKSIRYLALLFTSKKWGQGGLDNAARFVQEDEQRRDTYGQAVIHQMGEIHAQIYEWEQAIAAYDLYLIFYPLNPEAVVVHEKKILAMEEAGLRAAEERDLFLNLYGPGSQWRDANPDPELAERVDSKREMFLFKSTDEVTTAAVQSADPRALEEAIGFCHRFLDTFPESDRAQQVRMNLAMMLYNPPMERFLDAYQQFMVLCWEYPEGVEQRETAAKNSVASAYAMVEAERAETRVFTDDQRAEILEGVVIHSDFDSLYPDWYAELYASEILYCEALDTYLSVFPGGDDAPEFLWRAGKLFFDVSQYPMSRYWLVQVEERFADNKSEVEESNKLLLNGYIAEDDYSGIEARARHILGLGVDTEFKDSVRVRMAEAIFQSAESLRKQAEASGVAVDHRASGLEYRRCADETPDFEYADAALFNAGLELAAGQDFQGAVDVYLSMEERYPNSEYMDRALYNHAYILATELDDPSQAAEIYMRLYNNYPESSFRADALYNAGQSYGKAGNVALATQTSQTFAAAYPRTEEARTLLLGAAVLLGQSDDDAGASQVYQQFAQEFPDDPNIVRAHYERGMYLMTQDDREGARREFQMAADGYKELSQRGVEGVEVVRPLGSKSLFKVLEWEFQVYKDVKFTPRSRLSAQIAEKKRRSESLAEGYDQLIGWSEAEAITAMLRRAELLEEYADCYGNQDPPTDRNPLERAIKQLRIARDAVGYQELAIEEYLRVLDELPDIRVVFQERRKSATDEEILALDTLIASVTEKESYCKDKYLDLRLSNASHLNVTVNQLLNLPDYQRLTEQSQLKRRFTFWNTQLLPATLDALELYDRAVLAADSLRGPGTGWEAKARGETVDLVGEFLKQGSTLVQRAVKAYRETVSDYAKVLLKGDGATYKGLEASELAALADDYNKKANIYAQATVSTGEDLVNRLREYGFHKDRTSAVEDMITAFVVEYASLSEENIADAEKGLASSRVGYEDQQTVVFEDALFVFEQWILVWAQYQLDILKMGHRFVEDFSIVSTDADKILEKLAALDPGNYGTISPESPEQQ